MTPKLRNFALSAGIVGGAVALATVAILLRPEPPRTEIPPVVPTVTTAPVQAWPGPLVVEGSGTVRPSAEIEVVPQVTGRVVEVSPDFVSGGRVRAGQLLVKIEAADYLNQVAQARAQVAQDEVALLEAEEESRIAADEFRRFQARNGTSGEPSPLVLRRPQLDAARATVDRSLAALADAELGLSRTEIVAPFDGAVRSESVDLGAIARVGEALGTLYASDLVEVVVSLSDHDATLLTGLWTLSAGSATRRLPARVFTEIGGGTWMWEGYVDRAEAALDEQTRTIDVIVRVPDPFTPGRPPDSAQTSDEGPPLLVGQFARVEMEGRKGNHHLIPRAALRVDNEVWVVEGGRIRIVPIEVVQARGNDVFVRGELADGLPVIVSGITVATEGMRVELGSEMR
ncbi:MAG: efflux RND transporter periplasmic adaptor subunit [Longimicrobiales bacterium]|nr:efflux RND transporter periplasmic adaptor subunit [Longimicrobiales bacterium]